MTKRIFLMGLCCALTQAMAGNIVIIGHQDVPKLDGPTVLKIYTGKVISVTGTNVTPVGLPSGALVRNRFLQEYLGQDDEKYTAFWTVRRYIGKGTPPAELPSAADVIRYVQTTPGALGYVDEADIKPGTTVNVISRR